MNEAEKQKKNNSEQIYTLHVSYANENINDALHETHFE